jgi:hypothetical protein
MKSHTKSSTSLLREVQIHQAYASTNVRKILDTTQPAGIPHELNLNH